MNETFIDRGPDNLHRLPFNTAGLTPEESEIRRKDDYEALDNAGYRIYDLMHYPKPGCNRVIAHSLMADFFSKLSDLEREHGEESVAYTLVPQDIVVKDRFLPENADADVVAVMILDPELVRK